MSALLNQPTPEVLRAQMRAVLDAHPDLHAHGFGYPGDTGDETYDAFLKHGRAELLSDEGLGDFYRALAFLDECERLGFGACKLTRVPSFSLKHAAERYWRAHLGGFVPPCGDDPSNFVGNGAMIAAALHRGYGVKLDRYNPPIAVLPNACHAVFYQNRATFRAFAEASLDFALGTLKRFQYGSDPYKDVKRAIYTVRRAVRAAPPRPKEYTVDDTFAHVRGEVKEARDDINQIIERVE